jgi:hypothetical protein
VTSHEAIRKIKKFLICICHPYAAISANSENMADSGEYKTRHIYWQPSNASAKILYLNQISNNKKGYNIHQLAGKHPHKI